MSKNRYTWDEKKIQKYIKDGRGTGIGKDYKPWLEIQDVPSQGRSSRISGWKTSRLHHFLSDNERNYFYLLEWADNVVDIREQYPLLERDLVQQIAKDAGINHPKDIETQTPLVITTDFLISVTLGNKIIDVARTIKLAKELDNSRTIEKFEIERRYWMARGVDWGIVTEREISNDLITNIESIHKTYWLDTESDIDRNHFAYVVESIKRLIYRDDLSPMQIVSKLDDEINIARETSLKVLKYLIARREILIDINKPIDFFKRIKILNINSSVERFREKF